MVKQPKNRQASRGKRKAPPITLMPTAWDKGADGPANRLNLVEEERGEINAATGKRENPNGVRGVRRVDMLEVWHSQGTITTAGFNIAVKLRDAFEATQRSPGWPDNDRVQSSPKPDHAVTIQIDRISAFHRIHRHVIAEDSPIISHCVIMGATPASLRIDGKRPYYGEGYKRGLQHLSDALERLSLSRC